MHSDAKSFKGFSLLEVIIALSILSVLMISVTQLFKSNISTRQALSVRAKTIQRINRILTKLNYDLSHAFISSGGSSTLFKLIKSQEGEILRITYMSLGPKAVVYHSKQIDSSWGLYREELQDASDMIGRRDNTPEHKSDHEAPVFAKSVQVSFAFWDGSKWSEDPWDSTSGDTKDKLPHRLRITVRTWSKEPALDDPDLEYSTIVYLPRALSWSKVTEKYLSSAFKILE